MFFQVIEPVLLYPPLLFPLQLPHSPLTHLAINNAAFVRVDCQLRQGRGEAVNIVAEFMANYGVDNILWNGGIFKMAVDGNFRFKVAGEAQKK